MTAPRAALVLGAALAALLLLWGALTAYEAGLRVARLGATAGYGRPTVSEVR
jgi:hypothetical protein